MNSFQRPIALFVTLLFFIPTAVPLGNAQIMTHSIKPDFEFQLTNETVVNINVYTGKPTVIDWAASWCTICKANQRAMNALYEDYKSVVNFVSISYGNSRDTLSDVLSMKGTYEWDFGLDINNIAKTYQVTNGYVWVLDETLTLVQAFNYTTITSSQLQNALNPLLGITGSVEENPSENIDLLHNPLFISFIAIISLSAVTVVILRLKN